MSFWWILFLVVLNGLLSALLIYVLVVRAQRRSIAALTESLPKWSGDDRSKEAKLLRAMDKLMEDVDLNPKLSISKEDYVVINEIKKLKKAYLLFDGPSIMKIGETKRILVEVFRDELIYAAIDEKNRVAEIRMDNRITMNLLSKDFEIKAINTDTQIVLPDRKTFWNWDVKPVKSGSKKLELIATITLSIAKEKEIYDYPIYSKEILVKVNRIYSFQMFWGKYWDKILGIIFGSGILWVILKAVGLIK